MMHSKLLLFAPFFFAGFSVSLPQEQDIDIYGDWKPPGPGDVRGPCPMINTLANHGFIPRDGGMAAPGYTQSIMAAGLVKAVNFEQSFAELIWTGGTLAAPNPENVTSWNLEMISVHNVLEHDASLTRNDAYFGSNVLFNQTVFEESKKYWHGNIIDAKMISDSKTGRQFSSRVNNPTYTFTEQAEIFSIGEILSVFVAFGDKRAVTVRADWLTYWFQNERFPTELGWEKPSDQILRSDTMSLQSLFENSTSLITKDNAVAKRDRQDFHAGWAI